MPFDIFLSQNNNTTNYSTDNKIKPCFTNTLPSYHRTTEQKGTKKLDNYEILVLMTLNIHITWEVGHKT